MRLGPTPRSGVPKMICRPESESGPLISGDSFGTPVSGALVSAWACSGASGSEAPEQPAAASSTRAMVNSSLSFIEVGAWDYDCGCGSPPS